MTSRFRDLFGPSGRDNMSDIFQWTGVDYGRHRQAATQVQISASERAYRDAVARAETQRQAAALTAQLAAQWQSLHAEPEPQEPVENTGIELGEVVAWRAWLLRTDGFLESMAADTVWAPGESVRGEVEDHGKRGVHAFKELPEAVTQYATHAAVSLLRHYTSLVYGQISLWGDIVEHEKGYRAEHGRILSLDHIAPDTPRQRVRLRALQRKYGVTAHD